MELIVSYVGRTMIGSMVRFGKVPTNPELAGLIENCQGCGEFDRVRAAVDSTGSGTWRR